jgi:UDP-N-acetylmuramoyl-tripeptide--D-alanyl-D-alanine ligase
MKLSLKQIAEWVSGELHGVAGEAVPAATGYSINTRTLEPGDLFFAIRGERFDAHEFLGEAFGKGAVAAVVARQKLASVSAEVQAHPLIAVDDPLAALQALAAAVRRCWGRRVVAVTGSAGKTTTKEAIAAVLATQFQVLKSTGNLNNHFGLPLQLLKLTPQDDVAVVEMGMSAAGEIAALCEIAAPDWGVVTNVGNAHAEGFGDGIAGVARAKYELVAGVAKHAGERGVVVLNADDPYVAQFGRDFPGRVLYYGTAPVADVRAERIEQLGPRGSRFSLAIHGERSGDVSLNLLGMHNVANALAAIAVGMEAGIPLERCVEAIGSLTPDERRGQILAWRGATVINDCYNSNPEALQSMIRTLAAMPAERHIVVAGEMLELGPRAAELHRECGRSAAEQGIDIVIGVRGLAQHIVEAAAQQGREALFVETPQAAGEWLKANLRTGDAILLKASRGVRLELAVDVLKDSPAAP